MTPPAVSRSIVLLNSGPISPVCGSKNIAPIEMIGASGFFPMVSRSIIRWSHVLLVDVISWWPFTLIEWSAVSPVSLSLSWCWLPPVFSLCGCSAPSIFSGSSSWTSTWYSSSNVSWYVASPITAPQSGQLPPPVWPQAVQIFSGSCCTTGSGCFVSGSFCNAFGLFCSAFWPFCSVSCWFWFTESRVSIPLTHFGSFGSLIPATNSPREAASNLSASGWLILAACIILFTSSAVTFIGSGCSESSAVSTFCGKPVYVPFFRAKYSSFVISVAPAASALSRPESLFARPYFSPSLSAKRK